MTHCTDQELLSLLKTQDQDAFDEIHRRYWKKMLLVAWNHSKNNFIAKDIVQEAFINLWEKAPGLEIQSLSAFLATSIKFYIFRHYQKERRRAKLARDNYHFVESVMDEEKLDARFLQELIDGIVEEMPERCRLVFQLSRNKGMKNPEIAEKINITEKSVENTLTRALKIIRGGLKDHGLPLLTILSNLF